MKVLVVGAGGSLGDASVRELAARGHQVTAMSRRPIAKVGQVRALLGDALDEDFLGQVMGLHDVVVVAAGAGLSKTIRSRGTDPNGAIVRALVEAAGSIRYSGALIYLSTVKVGPARWSEEAGFSGTVSVDPYVASKRLAEQLLLEKLPTATALRVPAVIPPGSAALRFVAGCLARRIELRMPSRFDLGNPAVSQDEFVRQLARAVEDPRPGVLKMHASTASWNEIVSELAAKIPKRRMRIIIPVSAGLLKAAERAAASDVPPGLKIALWRLLDMCAIDRRDQVESRLPISVGLSLARTAG